MPTPPFDLMIVSDGRPELLARVEAALRGALPGRVALQLREPNLSPRELYELALPVRACTRRYGARLLISDRLDVALAVAADGVQLPERGLAPEVAREVLGAGAWIGASRHDEAGLRDAARGGASFATLSPLHAVAGKGAPIGLGAFARIAAAAPLPIFALGGVTSSDIAALLASGAHGVAVMREVLSSGDPAASTRKLLEALASVRS